MASYLSQRYQSVCVDGGMSPPLPVNVTESPEHITLSMSELLIIIVGIIFTLVKIIELESEQPLPAVPTT